MSLSQAVTRTSIKTAVDDPGIGAGGVTGDWRDLGPGERPRTSAELLSAAGGRATWKDVLRALQDDQARELAVSHYRARGFGPDDFGHKRPAREAMADALTFAEDRLELANLDQRAGTAARDRARAAIRPVRRRLEWELFP